MDLAARFAVLLACAVAGGTALTGAGTIDAGPTSVALQAAGTALLAVVGLLVARSALRVLRALSVADAAVAESPSLVILAWAGAALAMVSWILAAGAIGVALLAAVRVERAR
ncbi:MAG: hypothetical protein ABIG85_02640 [Chloroflexota bacterium]